MLDDNRIKCECVVTDEGNSTLEIKNIATVPQYQGNGYAKSLIDFIVRKYKKKYTVLQVGTGDSTLTIPFYEKCGFVCSHIIPDFFTDNLRRWSSIERYGVFEENFINSKLQKFRN